MTKHDNYRDNLYLLLARIKLIRDTIILNIDPVLFMEKTLDDIDFIHNSLGNLSKKIQGNQRLMDREELLNHLSELEWQFSHVLSEILGGNGSISSVITPSVKDKMLMLRKSSLERRETTETIEESAKETPKEPVLSANEINALLKDL